MHSLLFFLNEESWHMKVNMFYVYMHVPTFYTLTNFQEILYEYNAIRGLVLVILRLTGAWQTTLAPLNPVL